MKLIGLITFKNEENNLPDCLVQLMSVCDLVLGHDDLSVDNSKSIFKDFGGILIPNSRSLPWGNGGEFQIREKLLEYGRAAGGTHFICLDADEVLIFDNPSEVRHEIEGLLPGYALCYLWVNCWMNQKNDRILQDQNGSTFKDFVFADDVGVHYSAGKMHISRTPILDSNRIFSSLSNSVLHLQFVDYQNYLAKQLWYQLSEILYSNHPYYYVEYKYLKHMKRPKHLTSLNMRVEAILSMGTKSRNVSSFQQDRILELLKSLESDKVSHLVMWRLHFLRKLYVRAYGAEPPEGNIFRFFFSRLLLLQFVIRSKLSSWKAKYAK